ncbi:MAG: zinc ribbon domain-containing protein [Desulfovibrio sp.]|jgi:putative FmdB family regulatory protein|nr:zinc ribbon domain-containing protein [Desulfovibrio sp.]
MFDFVCLSCGTRFEELTHGDKNPVCPKCGAGGVKRQMSVPAPPQKKAFPFKPGPARPMPGMAGCGMPPCGAPSCGMGGCGTGCGEA